VSRRSEQPHWSATFQYGRSEHTPDGSDPFLSSSQIAVSVFLKSAEEKGPCFFARWVLHPLDSVTLCRHCPFARYNPLPSHPRWCSERFPDDTFALWVLVPVDEPALP